MGLAQEAGRIPVYRETQGFKPRLPRAPRAPHIPHPKALVVAVTLALAGTAVTPGTLPKEETKTVRNPNGGPVSAEQMKFPLGTQLLELSLGPSGELVEKTTTHPQVLRAISFNVGEGQGITFTEDVSTTDLQTGEALLVNPTTLMPESLENAYFVPVLGAGDDFIQGGDSPRGDAYLRLSDAEGNPVDGPNGLPIYTRLDQVNLTIPEQIPAPVKA